MKTNSMPCPSCGKPATGNFCSHCGTSIMSVCPSCNAEVKPGARVCHECGKSLVPQTTSQQTYAQTVAPWAAIGIASIALIVSLVSWFNRSGDVAAPAPISASSVASAPALGQPPDLSNMSPREAADRLFNRVMAANERGDSVEALRFAPMALQAYDNLGGLDNDARYHVALINMTADDIDGARVQREMLRKSVPNYLLGFMLEQQIAERNRNKDAAAKAYKAFLAVYDAEIAAGRAEYQDHRSSIEHFREAAKASVAGKK